MQTLTLAAGMAAQVGPQTTISLPPRIVFLILCVMGVLMIVAAIRIQSNKSASMKQASEVGGVQLIAIAIAAAGFLIPTIFALVTGLFQFGLG